MKAIFIMKEKSQKVEHFPMELVSIDSRLIYYFEIRCSLGSLTNHLHSLLICSIINLFDPLDSSIIIH